MLGNQVKKSVQLIKLFLSLLCKVPVKNRTIASKIPPRFAKKQGSMSIEQPDDALSSNNLGTEIWESNSSGIKQTPLCVNALFMMLLLQL